MTSTDEIAQEWIRIHSEAEQVATKFFTLRCVVYDKIKKLFNATTKEELNEIYSASISMHDDFRIPKSSIWNDGGFHYDHVLADEFAGLVYRTIMEEKGWY